MKSQNISQGQLLPVRYPGTRTWASVRTLRAYGSPPEWRCDLQQIRFKVQRATREIEKEIKGEDKKKIADKKDIEDKKERESFAVHRVR